LVLGPIGGGGNEAVITGSNCGICVTNRQQFTVTLERCTDKSLLWLNRRGYKLRIYASIVENTEGALGVDGLDKLQIFIITRQLIDYAIRGDLYNAVGYRLQ